MDIRLHGLRHKLSGITRATHVVSAEGRLCNAPQRIRIIEHVVRVGKVRVVEQRAVVAELSGLLHSGSTAAITAAGGPAQHGQAPLHHSGLAAGQILVALFVLIRHAATLRGGLLLRHSAGVGEDHELIQAQLLFRPLPVGDLKPDIPGIVGNAELVPGHILVILHAGVHVALGDGSLPVFAVGAYRDPGLVVAQTHIGGTKRRPDAADAIHRAQVYCKQRHRSFAPVRIRQLAAGNVPVAFLGVHIAAVCFAAFRQDHLVVLFQDLQQLILAAQVRLDRKCAADFLIVHYRHTAPVVTFGFVYGHGIGIGGAAIAHLYLQRMFTGLGNIHLHIALIV